MLFLRDLSDGTGRGLRREWRGKRDEMRWDGAGNVVAPMLPLSSRLEKRDERQQKWHDEGTRASYPIFDLL
jgi:hypothetical protein